jgi:hypothetical protein
MKSYAAVLALFLLVTFTSTAIAQKTDPPKDAKADSPKDVKTDPPRDAKAEMSVIPAPPPITDKSTPMELAKAALAAMGGDNFKKLKSSFVTGSANLYAPNQAGSIPGKFGIATAGEKVRVDVDAQPIIVFKQIYDGERSFSTIPGIEIPPPSKFGLPLLGKLDQPGYVVSAIPDKKKLRGFRITNPEGNTTDYYLDPVTARVSEYIIPWQGYTFGSSITKFAEVDGVLVPMAFSQRFEMPQGAYFAEYKVKSVKLNGPIANDVFVIQ